jgi:ribosomal protein S18 acetylase RimI-like enzyme
LGPISVDPEAQNEGVGRQLMSAAMDEAQRRVLAFVAANYTTMFNELDGAWLPRNRH